MSSFCVSCSSAWRSVAQTRRQQSPSRRAARRAGSAAEMQAEEICPGL